MSSASIENIHLAQSFSIKYESKLYFDLLAIAKNSVAMVNFKFAIIIPFYYLLSIVVWFSSSGAIFYMYVYEYSRNRTLVSQGLLL